MDAVRVLDDSQVEAFDKEYLYDKRWQIVKACLDRDFPDGDFRLLDVGGGNGLFADKVLREYPNAQVTVLDNSKMLLDRNRPHERKNTMLASATDLHADGGTYDVISCYWLLHHLVGDTYGQSIRNIQKTLRSCRRLLTRRGRMSVWENLYDGIFVDGAPGWNIYQLTSIRSPLLAKLVKAGGANTAGVGVCFQSTNQWIRHFLEADMAGEVVRDSIFRSSKRSLKHVALHARPIGPGHFWLRPV
jgi:ubiquinone/menaquinone biosynthesis C-methylase UbiE